MTCRPRYVAPAGMGAAPLATYPRLAGGVDRGDGPAAVGKEGTARGLGAEVEGAET